MFELRDGFRWIGIDSELTAEDLYNRSKKQRGRPAEKSESVKSVVLRLLESGEPMLSAELESAVCELTGCHSNTVTRVKKELGVESYQSGRQWFSVLPGQNTKNSQDTINS